MKHTVWKEIRLGVYVNSIAIRKAFKKSDAMIGKGANRLLNQIEHWQKAKTEVTLGLISTSELGFSSGVSLEVLYNRAISYGLELCPAELAFALRLEYINQPKPDWFRIAMKPLLTEGHPVIFALEHDDDGLWVDWTDGSPDLIMSVYSRMIWIIPK